MRTGGSRTALAVPIGLALALLMTLTACNQVGQGDVDAAFEDVGGVQDTRLSCAKGQCWVDVRMRPTAGADELTDALAAARSLDAETVSVALGPESRRVGVEVGEDATDSWDRELADALLVYAQDRDLAHVGVHLGSRIDVTARTVRGADVWDKGVELWPTVADLGDDVRFEVGEEPQEGAPLRRLLVASGSLPTDGIAVARHLEDRLGDSGLSGVAVQPDGTYVGVLDAVRLPDEVRRLAAEAPGTSAEVEPTVVVTDSIHQFAARPDDRVDHTALLARLQRRPEVDGAVQTLFSVDVRLVDLADGVDLYPVIAEGVGGHGSSVVLTSALGDQRVELVAGSDPALVGLAARVASSGADVDTLEVEQRQDRVPSLSLTVRAPRLRPEVVRAAGLVQAWAQDQAADRQLPASLHVSLTAEDPEGRRPGVSWTVDLTGATPALQEVRGTEEQVALVEGAWAQVSSGAPTPRRPAGSPGPRR